MFADLISQGAALQMVSINRSVVSAVRRHYLAVCKHTLAGQRTGTNQENIFLLRSFAEVKVLMQHGKHTSVQVRVKYCVFFLFESVKEKQIEIICFICS